jgi:hypothetical protein
MGTIFPESATVPRSFAAYCGDSDVLFPIEPTWERRRIAAA